MEIIAGIVILSAAAPFIIGFIKIIALLFRWISKSGELTREDVKKDIYDFSNLILFSLLIPVIVLLVFSITILVPDEKTAVVIYVVIFVLSVIIFFVYRKIRNRISDSYKIPAWGKLILVGAFVFGTIFFVRYSFYRVLVSTAPPGYDIERQLNEDPSAQDKKRAEDIEKIKQEIIFYKNSRGQYPVFGNKEYSGIQWLELKKILMTANPDRKDILNSINEPYSEMYPGTSNDYSIYRYETKDVFLLRAQFENSNNPLLGADLDGRIIFGVDPYGSQTYCGGAETGYDDIYCIKFP